jgi:hypothetical protein
MIRDPSDGTVREAPRPGERRTEKPSGAHGAQSGPDTGLRQPVRTDAMQRLDKSREWLRDYHAKKEREHARGSNDTEHSTDGRAIDDQGQGES